jgi:multidrug efflux pump subunit AcrA (membrane-fusion protein)
VPEDDPEEIPEAAIDPIVVAESELAEAEKSLEEFDLVHPRPKAEPSPVRAWFSLDGQYSFYGRAIDMTGNVVILQHYDDGRKIEVDVARLKEVHQQQLADAFDNYQNDVEEWKRKRRELEVIIEERITFRDNLKAEAEIAAAERQAKLEQERLARSQARKEQRLKQAKIDRREKIKSAFSFWDGSHIKLTQKIKDEINDPGSYEHIKTRYIDTDDHLIVITEFRARNAFGGVVKYTARAEVTLSGRISNLRITP